MHGPVDIKFKNTNDTDCIDIYRHYKLNNTRMNQYSQKFSVSSLSFLRACCYIYFHHQLTHTIKTLSQFSFKTVHVKNVCDAYLKLI